MTRRLGTGRTICIAIAAVAAIVSVLLRLHVPVLTLPTGASGYDDGLFIRQASNLAGRHWLGSFDNLTLAKGMAFPAFIALMHGLRVPLMLGIQATVLAAALALAAAVWVVTRRDWLATVTFVVLALDPMNYSYQAARVIRDDWYAALALLFVSLLFLAVYGAARGRSLPGMLGLGFLGGLCGAAFWLCREEGPWIVPSVLIAAMVLPLGLYLRGRRQPIGERAPDELVRRRKVAVGAALVAALVGLGVPIEIVRAENDSHYGAALTNDMASGEIARAYADWSRVRAGPLIYRVPFSREQRQAVYAVSPAARQLRSYLESKQNPWAQGECSHGISCDELTGRVEIWALRSAAAQRGHFSSESAAQDFFAQLDDQINAACDSGRLDCATQLPVGLQPLQHTSLSGLTDSFTAGIWDLFTSSRLYSLVRQVPPLTQADRNYVRSIVGGLPATQAEADQGVSDFVAGDWI